MAAKDTAQELIKKSQRSPHGLVAVFVIPLIIILGLYFFYLTQAYYFSTDNSYIVLRAGSPQFTFLPGFGRVMIQTDFKRGDLVNDEVRDSIDQGKVQGFWFLHSKEGYELWGEQLAGCLEPVTQAKWLRLLRPTKYSIERLSQSMVSTQNPTVPLSIVFDSEQFAQTNPESFTPEIVHPLTALLTDKDFAVRSSAASTLRQIAETRPEFFTPQAVQSLTALLTDKDYIMHSEAAVLVLGQLAQTKPEVGRSLTALLADKHRDVRSRAAFALEQLARSDPASFTPEIVPSLSALLADKDSNVRSRAVSALGQLAQTRPEFFTPGIVQSLITLLADEVYNVRSGAASALGQLARTRPEFFTSEIIESLTALLADRESLVRSSAALAMGQFAQTRSEFFSPGIVASLTTLLGDSGSFVPCSAAFALRQLAQTRPEFFTPEIVQSLTALLTDEDFGVRSNVGSALEELAQTNPASFTPETVQSLSVLLTNEDSVVHSSAASALGRLTQKEPGIIQALFDLLRNGKDSNGRNGAAEGLFVAALKDSSQKDFIDQELEKLTKSPQPYLRVAASQTLEMIVIGDLTQKAHAHPDQIDYIKSRLNDLKGIDESLHEGHLQFAAQIVLNEIDKIKPENK